jgi:hypothetical protein
MSSPVFRAKTSPLKDTNPIFPGPAAKTNANPVISKIKLKKMRIFSHHKNALLLSSLTTSTTTN